MTCIVGLVTPDGVLIGGDSAGVSGYSLSARADEKVFINGDFIFGFTTSFRMGQILRYSFKPPVMTTEKTVEEFMATTFVNSIRAAFKAAGYLRTDNSVETAGEFLVGHKGMLFKVAGDFQIARNILPFDAVGCGAEIACGALYTLHKQRKSKEGTNKSNRDIVILALAASEEFSAGVRAPFVVKFKAKT